MQNLNCFYKLKFSSSQYNRRRQNACHFSHFWTENRGTLSNNWRLQELKGVTPSRRMFLLQEVDVFTSSVVDFSAMFARAVKDAQFKSNYNVCSYGRIQVVYHVGYQLQNCHGCTNQSTGQAHDFPISTINLWVLLFVKATTAIVAVVMVFWDGIPPVPSPGSLKVSDENWHD